MGARNVLSAEEPETKRAMLSVIAIAAGLRIHGKFLVSYSEDELLAMEPRACKWLDFARKLLNRWRGSRRDDFPRSTAAVVRLNG